MEIIKTIGTAIVLTLILFLVVCAFSYVASTQDNQPPSWNYTPMRTVGVFEGLEVGVHRPVNEYLTMQIIAKVDGVELEKTATIKLTMRDGIAFAEFPMSVGSLDDFKIEVAAVTNGDYKLIQKNPLPAVNYVMEQFPVVQYPPK